MSGSSAKKNAKAFIVVSPDSGGNYHIPAIALGAVAKVDAADVDIVLTTKSGEHYVLPGAALDAMTKPTAEVAFAEKSVAISSLFADVGTVANLGTNIPVPSSFEASTQAAQQNEQSQQQSPSDTDVSVLNIDPVASIEKLIAEAQHINDQIHNHDYDYVPPPRPAQPSAPPSMPPGEPAPAFGLPWKIGLQCTRSGAR